MYGPFTNEQLVGKAHRRPPRRGRRWPPSSATSAARTAAGSASTAARSTSARPVDASLQRLGVDHIDLYYQHRVDRRTPDRGDLGRAGRARRGRQGPPPRHLRGGPPTTIRARARRAPGHRAADRVVAVDPRRRGRRRAGHGPRARHRVRRLLARSAAASCPARSAASTTSPPDDFRRHNPRFQGENFARNLELVDKVREIAAEKGVTADPAGAGLGARPGRGRRADPRHQAGRLPRGERRPPPRSS